MAEYSVETEGLSRAFGDVVAVQDLDLKVRSGEVFGLLGPNGAGKTTTVRLLTCLISPSAGTASVLGLDVRDPGEAMRIRRQVGLLTETPGMYDDLSAWRNLEFYAKLYEVPSPRREEQLERYLKTLGLWDRRDDLVGKFSKGMRQKLAITRALLHDPQVLFLDEPTAGLDPEASRTVREFIEELKREGRTIFLCTHNLDEADRLCDRIGVMKRTLKRVDSPDNFRKTLYSRKSVVHLEKLTPALRRVVEGMSFVRRLQVVDDRLVVEVDDPGRRNPAIVEALVKAGARIQFVSELRVSLEDVYFKLLEEA